MMVVSGFATLFGVGNLRAWPVLREHVPGSMRHGHSFFVAHVQRGCGDGFGLHRTTLPPRLANRNGRRMRRGETRKSSGRAVTLALCGPASDQLRSARRNVSAGSPVVGSTISQSN